ncbi:MAG: glycosyltransferase family 4 protein, partial [Opitutaceae bacterium]
MGVDYTVLHYVGAGADRGGILSVVRTLAGTREFACVLGVNPGFVQRREPRLETLELPRIAGERIGPGNFWRARAVALVVRAWLQEDPRRIFHGHSRAGLLVALWLQWMGEPRTVVSVHCYGRQRWFYRWAARRLGGRLYWLTPAMKRHYRVGDDSWVGCIPDGIRWPATPVMRRGWGHHGRLRLGGVGTLVGWKRWDVVLSALRQLEPVKRGHLEFRHLGDADDSADSAHCAAALRIQATDMPVVWCGWRDDPRLFYDEIDVLVVASDQEPFSMAMLEALSAGVPVLAADTGGPADVIRPAVNGWLFKSGDAADLARHLS